MSATFGNTSIGDILDANDANAQSVSYFQCNNNGQVTDIVAYVAGITTGNCMAGLYAVSGGVAGALLAQSSPVAIGTSYSWVTFHLATPVTVTSGTTYGLAILGDVIVNLAIVSGTGVRSPGPGNGDFASGFTNPFGTIWSTDPTGAMSIYSVVSTVDTHHTVVVPQSWVIGGVTHNFDQWTDAGATEPTNRTRIVDLTSDMIISFNMIPVASPPVALFTFVPTAPVTGETVSFDASASHGQGTATIALYEWQFGDGATLATSLPTATHVYANSATYPATLTVTDSLGQKSSVTHQVAVGQPRHTLNITVVGGGIVTVYPSSTDGTYAYGTSVDITPTANMGYYLDSWTDNGVSKPVASKLTVVMTVDHAVNVIFAQIPAQKWTLIISASPTGGGVTNPTGIQLYNVGTSATVNAVEAEGYYFSKWTLDGADIGTTKTILIPSQAPNASLNLVAVFVKKGAPNYLPAVLGIAGAIIMARVL